ncbi:MAG: C/D box methylation guide ribonucleoprotein complex aNOP56 subunit [Thermoprotei archaeon]|nr:MAG: C/D box methylation guide ribonucleoprotein complex aNOP56 subunit [Thermoprotei archaeon]
MPKEAHLVPLFFGVFLCDDEGNVLFKAPYPEGAERMASRLMSVERGELVEEVRKACEEARRLGFERLVVENEGLAKSITRELGLTATVTFPDRVAEQLRSKMPSLAVEAGVAASEEDYVKLLHDVAFQLSRSKVKMAVEKQDLFVAQAVTALDEVDRVINLLVSRVREWYGYHFPEVNQLLPDHESFVKLVAKLGLRDKVSEEALRDLGLPPDKAASIAKAAAASIGADLDEAGIKPLADLASLALALYSLRRSLEGYISNAMSYVAPNIKGLVGPLVGARLIALAGGLEKLAKMPTSTIQLLGAEKALFRALRTGTKPPKHGVIFQCPEIHRAPRWQRGKIARALAGKLAIAARVDYFTGEYIADELREDLNERIKEIKEVYAKPPPKAKEKVKKPPRKAKPSKKRRR